MTIFTLNILWFQIAPTYYWLMYGISFLLGYVFLKKYGKIDNKYLDDLLLYIFIWVIFGGRFGYIFFYDFIYYLQNLSEIYKVWNGWMSFHGWVLWVIVSLLIFSRKYKIWFLRVLDQVALVAPIWLFFWRIGNYINWELLWFSWYTGPFAIYKWDTWYFPSTLLEAFLEWALLLTILLYIYRKQKFDWQIGSLFLIWYGVFRIFVELFFREPDIHIGLLFWVISTGSLLSLPMIIVGGFFYLKLQTKK